MEGEQSTCCVCSAPCGVTPPSRAARGQTICIKCSAAGRKPPPAAGQSNSSDLPDEAQIEVEGYSEQDVAVLAESQRAPPPAAGPHPTEAYVRSTTRSRRVCEKCKAALPTGDENICPACGHLCRHFTSQARIAEENEKDYAEHGRRLTRLAWSLFAGGAALTVAIRVGTGNAQGLLEDAKHLSVAVPVGLVCYYLACILFLGIDGTLSGPLTRLASVYVALNGLFVAMLYLPMSGCIALIMIPAVLLVGYLFMLRRALELEYLEAGIFLVPSACVIFGAIVITWYMRSPA